MQAAREKIAAEKVTFVNALLKGGDYDKIFIDKAAFLKPCLPEKLLATMTEETVHHAQVAVDAASILPRDRACSSARLGIVLDQRQIKISEVRELKFEEVLKKKLDEYLEQSERESLFAHQRDKKVQNGVL